MRTRVTVVAVAWAVAALLAVTHGLDVLHCGVLAVCVTVIVAAWPDGEAGVPTLPPPPDRLHSGARPEVARLAWHITDSDGGVTQRGVARVRALAGDDPSLAPLRRAIDATPAPSLADVNAWLDVIAVARGSIDSSSSRVPQDDGCHR